MGSHLVSHRLRAPAGAWIDRSRPLTFNFNSRVYRGYHGDTLASALIANDVRLIGRSFKLHRPRGVWSCGVEEPNAIVDVGAGARRTPNVRATLLPLSEGLNAASVNCWPGVRFDVGAIAGAFSALLPAGFYYKTFKWPSWRLFEPAIRRMAGLGNAPTEPDPDHYEEVSAEAEVLVVGAGTAGLAAAAAAARAGAQTLLLARSEQLGGALGWRADPEIATLESAARAAGVRILARTVAFGVYDHNLVCALETLSATGRQDLPACVLRERLWKIRARKIIAATGAFERPMLFADNDRPGVMLSGAALKYALAYGVACGRRAVIATASDAAYGAAAALRASGIEIVAIIDRRTDSHSAQEVGAVRVMHGAAVTRVLGRRCVRGCQVQSIAGSSAAGSRGGILDCDLILNAGGFAPAVHLHSQAGGRLRWLAGEAMWIPDGAAPGLVSVGACAGVFSREIARAHAAAVGEAIARGQALPETPVGGGGNAQVFALSPVWAASSSSTSRMMWRHRTSSSPRARTTARSSTSSATPRPAWEPTRARPVTSTRCC